MPADHVVVTCEHAGNRVPARYAGLFHGSAARAALAGHRGYDPGALFAARVIARRFGVPLIGCTTTRLLVEVNRSLHHPRLFSPFSRQLDAQEKERVLERVYRPHRIRVAGAVASHLSRARRIVHVGVHSFTPSMHGRTRTADIGLLYDPAREREARLCEIWLRALGERTSLRVRRNYPYRGNSDGLTTTLRRLFPRERYLGLELEVNQHLLRGPTARRTAMVRAIADTLAAAMADRS